MSEVISGSRQGAVRGAVRTAALQGAQQVLAAPWDAASLWGTVWCRGQGIREARTASASLPSCQVYSTSTCTHLPVALKALVGVSGSSLVRLHLRAELLGVAAHMACSAGHATCGAGQGTE